MLESQVLKSTKSFCRSSYAYVYECICYICMKVCIYVCTYVCWYVCIYMLYLVWPFGSLYYGDKLSSGISQWKTTVVCQPQVSVNLKVNFVCSTVFALHIVHFIYIYIFFVKWGVQVLGFLVRKHKRGVLFVRGKPMPPEETKLGIYALNVKLIKLIS